MKVDVLLGLQWGDEGKGKVVDVLTPNYSVVARFQGGPNAGHTLEFEGQKYVLRSIPSGIFQGGKINVIGNGVVLDPLLFKEEAEALAASGHDITKQLYISKKAHLILPTHRVLDRAYEAAKGSGKIGFVCSIDFNVSSEVIVTVCSHSSKFLCCVDSYRALCRFIFCCDFAYLDCVLC